MKVNNRYCSFYQRNDPVTQEISYRPNETALMLIDLQNYFVDRPDFGSKQEAHEWEEMYRYIHETVIPNNERLLTFARENEILVVHAVIESSFEDGRERSLSHRRPTFNNIIIAPNTYESKIIEPLTPQKNEVMIKKTAHSAVDSSLVLLLNNLGITDIIATRLVTDQCVSSTVRGLSDHNFRVWVVEDATMAGTFELRDNELTILNNTYCNVVNTEEIVNVLSKDESDRENQP